MSFKTSYELKQKKPSSFFNFLGQNNSSSSNISKPSRTTTPRLSQDNNQENIPPNQVVSEIKDKPKGKSKIKLQKQLHQNKKGYFSLSSYKKEFGDPQVLINQLNHKLTLYSQSNRSQNLHELRGSSKIQRIITNTLPKKPTSIVKYFDTLIAHLLQNEAGFKQYINSNPKNLKRYRDLFNKIDKSYTKTKGTYYCFIGDSYLERDLYISIILVAARECVFRMRAIDMKYVIFHNNSQLFRGYIDGLQTYRSLNEKSEKIYSNEVFEIWK